MSLSDFALVVDGPIHLPRFTAIGRRFPTPVEFVGGDIFPDHALEGSLAVLADSFALKNHLAVFEVSGEIKIAALVVDPGLLPMRIAGHENGYAGAAQIGRVLAGEIFLNDAVVHDALDRVRAMAGFTGILAGPSEVPFADPEIKLLLLRGGAGILGSGADWAESADAKHRKISKVVAIFVIAVISRTTIRLRRARKVTAWRLVPVSGTSNSLSLQFVTFLFFAGVLGGALNSVAGGGSFIAFPALLFTGVPPIPANATNTIALWTAAAASGGAYRKQTGRAAANNDPPARGKSCRRIESAPFCY